MIIMIFYERLLFPELLPCFWEYHLISKTNLGYYVSQCNDEVEKNEVTGPDFQG